MNQSDLLSKLPEHSSTQQTLEFEYSMLDAETRTVVQQCTDEIKSLMRRTSQDIIDIGQKLIEVKQYLQHGSFMKWLKSEFNWSVSTATKFMQVAEQFKFVNFTNLNINASALYLIAAPFTPKEARKEVLERASLGESISYTKAKAIVSQHNKKIAKSKPDELVTVDVSAKTTKSNFCTSIEPAQYKTSAAFSATEGLTEKEVKLETRSLSSKELLPFEAFEEKQVATTMTTEIAIIIKKLTPEELALVITNAANSGLSGRHLEAVISAAQQALKQALQNRGMNRGEL